MKLILILCLSLNFYYLQANPVGPNEVFEFTCDMIDEETCLLSNIVVNKTNYLFKVITDDYLAVKKVKFQDSQIEYFGPSICTYFWNLEVLEAARLRIQDIDENSFIFCSKLKSLSLSGNELLSLPVGLFRENNDLTKLYLDYNRLGKLDPSLFTFNGNLQNLYLSGNRLTNLETNVIRPLRSVRVLYIDSNDISNLNLKDIRRWLPRLTEIAYNGNDLSCTQLIQAARYFKELEIKISESIQRRKRYYDVLARGQFVCARDEDWTGLFYRKKNKLIDLEGEEKTSNAISNVDKNVQNHINSLRDLLNEQFSKLRTALED